ncbi:MAG: iron-sulfur cluster assembly accessory protein [Spirulinaceae cyanobacterium]
MIELSSAARKEIKRLQVTRHQVNSNLRLGVKSGGCADFSYTLDFAETVNPEDSIWETDGISIVVENQSQPYLQNLTLDFTEDLMGGGFRFHNPLASNTCDCGYSFSAKV